jgi:hypothetical protein
VLIQAGSVGLDEDLVERCRASDHVIASVRRPGVLCELGRVVDEQVSRTTVWWLESDGGSEQPTRQTGHASAPPHAVRIETVRYLCFLFVGVQVSVERAVPLHVFFGCEGIATQFYRVGVGAGQRRSPMVMVSIDAKVFGRNSI